MNANNRVTVPGLRSSKGRERLVAVTAYDFSLARICDCAGVDIILVGDSLAMVVQGEATTLPVTLDEIVYHSRCVARGASRALVVGDLPFMTYQVSPEQALQSAGRLMKEGGVAAVKLEGGEHMADTVRRLVEVDIPVMGHVGLTPQSFHRMGGHRRQGVQHAAEGGVRAGTHEQVLADALALDKAGVFSIVVEGVPAELAREISQAVSVPTIGIGAGPDTDGQILVLHDLLGLTVEGMPKFVTPYAALGAEAVRSVERFGEDVRSGRFLVGNLMKQGRVA